MFYVEMRGYHIIVLGAGGAGKSSLTVRFTQGHFLEHYNPTIQDQYHHTVNIDGEPVTLDIIDTAGAEHFTSLDEVHLMYGHGYLLVLSLIQKSSLEDLAVLRRQILLLREGESDVPMVIVGAKMDLRAEREVTHDMVQDLIKRWNIPYFETSARRNWGVDEVFKGITRMMRRHYPDASLKRRRRRLKECIIM